MKQPYLLILMIGVIIGCNPKNTAEQSQLQAKVDSLQLVVETQNYYRVLLEQTGRYLDSIDTYRNWVEINLETGITENDYIERMRNLNLYVQKAEWTIGELEKTRSAYASQVRRLKDQLRVKDDEIQKLIAIVESSTQERDLLENTLMISENELMQAKLELNASQEQLNESELMIGSLNDQLMLTAAESLYRQGENKEELAGHIQFSPKKKRKTLEEAMQLYKASYDQGFAPGQEKYDSLVAALKD